MKYFTQQLPRQFVLTSSALAAALLLSACGGGGDATPPAVADTTAPTLAITDSVAAAIATGDVTFTFTASEAIASTSFTASDIMVVGGTKGAFTVVSPTVATLVVTPTANTAGTVTVDLAAGEVTDLAGNANAAAATQATQAYNTIPATAGNTGTCVPTATAACFGFNEATIAFTPFGDIAIAEGASDPTNAANTVLKIVKPAPSQPWAGVTISTVAADQSVAAFGLATNRLVTLRVYSPAAGLPILLKLENAADTNAFIQKSVNTTVANAWETLTFDFAGFNAATVYNKVSVFPNFNIVESSPKTYYFDELKYTVAAAVVVPPSAGLTFASNYGVNMSAQGGTTGRYVDDANVNGASSWDGIAAATDTIRSFFFGYHMNSAASPAWGFGGYAKAPNNGTANVAAYSAANLTVWGNTELFNRNPTVTVIMIGPDTAGCTPKIKGTISTNSINPTAYTLAKSSMSVEVSCPNFNTVNTIWNGGVNEVHMQVLGNQVQYVTSNAAGFPNGLNIGSITFQ